MLFFYILIKYNIYEYNLYTIFCSAIKNTAQYITNMYILLTTMDCTIYNTGRG